MEEMDNYQNWNGTLKRLDDPDVPPTLRAATGPWQMRAMKAGINDF